MGIASLNFSILMFPSEIQNQKIYILNFAKKILELNVQAMVIVTISLVYASIRFLDSSASGNRCKRGRVCLPLPKYTYGFIWKWNDNCSYGIAIHSPMVSGQFRFQKTLQEGEGINAPPRKYVGVCMEIE